MSRLRCSTSWRAANIKTTFFVIGEKLAQPERRKLAERAKAEGHWIANHSYTHSRAARSAHRARHRRARDRPHPGGDRRSCASEEILPPVRRRRQSRPAAAECRASSNSSSAGSYTCVLWNAIPRDWDDPDGWVEPRWRNARRQPWPLMVLHDLPTGAMTPSRPLSRLGRGGRRRNSPGIPAYLRCRSSRELLFCRSMPMSPASRC